jgi:two-component system NtrC family sensor kinase
LDPLVEKALEGEAGRGIIILHEDELAAEGSDLPREAFIPLVPTPRAKPTPKESVSAGMMLWAAAPIYDDNRRVIGTVYGGTLINRNWSIVDEIRDIVFGEDRYDSKDLGTVTIFQWDVRVATNVKNKQGNRAIGTRVSAEVYDRVIENGQKWYDRAFVVNDWYLSSYEPIRDPRGKIIGILYTGVLERKYTDQRNAILRAFIVPVVLLIIPALFLSFLLARSIAKPVKELVTASERLAEGDLKYRPRHFPSCRELDRLSEGFGRMADALKERDDHLRRKNEELEESNNKLTQLNRSYMDMLGFVTHELKTPLTSMVFGASSLRDEYLGPLNEKQKKFVDTVLRNAEYLEEMIAHYLDLSRIEKGEMQVHKRDIELLTDVMEPVEEQVRNQIMAADMEYERDVPEGIHLHGDPGLLRIVLDNLLSNAAKYGREGGRIDVKASQEADRIRVSVWNEGEGIAVEDIPKLFGKFVRLEQAGAKGRKGTGLGLFVSREVVQKHGGDMWVESEPGWVKFTFEVPVDGQEKTDESAAS